MVFEQSVTSSQPSAWDRAVVRAIARNVPCYLVSEQHDGQDVDRHYVTGSISKPGSTHHVSVHQHNHAYTAYCDCQAGQRSIACQHAAAALVNLGVLYPR